MKSVLLLVHRIPFPPDKGDKIRSYNLLLELRKHFNVFLGAFVDDQDDLRHREHLESLCAELCLVPVSKPGCMLRSLVGLGQGRSVTSSWYRVRRMQMWADNVARREKLAATLAFSSGMGQFFPPVDDCATRIMDFVDLDSAKWERLATEYSGPKRWLYRREAKLVARDEVNIADAVAYSSFVSEEEANLIRSRVQRPGGVRAIRNGIDCDYFDPAIEFDSPFEESERAIVFTGAMDYWANVDAVKWFAKSVLPLVRERLNNAVFYIVGSKPTSAVQKIGQQEGVVVTGRVADVRPFLVGAGVVVAPLKLARGVQNKVLEAMAMARPIVATSAAMEGIGDPGLADLAVTDAAIDFATACIAKLETPAGQMRAASLREYVQSGFSWRENLRPLISLIETAPTGDAR